MFVVMTNNKPCHTKEGFNLWVCLSIFRIANIVMIFEYLQYAKCCCSAIDGQLWRQPCLQGA